MVRLDKIAYAAWHVEYMMHNFLIYMVYIFIPKENKIY